MNLWKALLLFFIVTVFSQVPGVAQSPVDQSTSFAGEWASDFARGSVIVIEQEDMKLRGSWKGTLRDRDMTCSGFWFEGTISGSQVSGPRRICSGSTQLLDLKIVDADTLEITALAPGGGASVYTLLNESNRFLSIVSSPRMATRAAI